MRSMPKVDINRLAFLENPLPSLVLEGNGRVATLNEEARMLLGGQTEGRLIQEVLGLKGAESSFSAWIHKLLQYPQYSERKAFLVRLASGENLGVEMLGKSISVDGEGRQEQKILLTLISSPVAGHIHEGILENAIPCVFLENILERINEGVCLWDHEGTIYYCNSFFAQAFGFEKEKALGKPIFQLLKGKDLEKCLRGTAQSKTGIPATCEIKKTQDNGTCFYILLKFVPAEISGSTFVICVVSDITSSAEERIFLDTLLKNLPVGLAMLDTSRRVWKYFNREASKILGYPEEDLTGIPISKTPFLAEEAFPYMKAGTLKMARMAWRKASLHGRVASTHLPVRRPNGEIKILLARAIPISERGQKNVLWIFLDETERFRSNEERNKALRLIHSALKRISSGDFNVEIPMEQTVPRFSLVFQRFNQTVGALKAYDEALKAERAYARAIVEHLPVPLLLLSPEGSLLAVNSTGATFFGKSQEDLDKEGLEGILLSSCLSSVNDAIKTALFKGQSSCEAVCFTANGEAVPVIFDCSNLSGIPGKEDRLLAVLTDISGLKNTQEELERSRVFYEYVLNGIPAGLIIGNSSGEVFFVNRTFADFLGATREPLEQKGWKSFLSDKEELVNDLRAIEEGTKDTVTSQAPIKLPDKDERILSITLAPVNFYGDRAVLGIAVDSTERLRQQAEIERLLREREETIRKLSNPMIPVWIGTILIPLVGNFNQERLERLAQRIFEQVPQRQVRSIVFDLSGIHFDDDDMIEGITRMFKALKFMGIEVLVTGITPYLAKKLEQTENFFRFASTFPTLERALFAVLKKNP